MTTDIATRNKILYFEDGQGFGGSLISLSELIDGVAATSSIDPIVLTSVNTSISDPLFREHSHAQFRRLATYKTRFIVAGWLETLPLPKPIRRALFNFYLLGHAASELADSIRLFVFIKNQNIDIVHINNGWVDSAIRASIWAKRPLVLHFRGFYNSPLTTKQINQLTRNKTRLIAISDSVRDSLISAGFPSSLIEVVYNPINIEKYDKNKNSAIEIRSKYRIHENDVVISIFGRVTKWKGQLEFLQAVQKIAGKLSNIRVMIVGDESDASIPDYLNAIHSIAKSPLLSGRVIFTGYQNEPVSYYWASDMVVHNSQEPEPFGRVVTEAMACQRAVIAMNEGGPAEIITHGLDGLLIPPRDVNVLSEAILELASSGELREKLGKNARKSVEQKYSHYAIANKVMGVYSTLQNKE